MTTFQKPSWNYEETTLTGITDPVLKVTEQQCKEYLQKIICSYWEESISDTLFPAPQPVSIEKKDFIHLKKEKYVVCAKLDGERFLLFCTKVPSSFTSKKHFKINYTFLVDRNLNFYIVLQNFSSFVFAKNTLFDGELMNNRFVIHDTFVINGMNLMKQNWYIRWDNCNRFLQSSGYNYNESCQFDIKLKKFFKLESIANLFEEIRTKNIKSDGLVFYPMEEPVKYKQQNDLFKWKPPGHHTIDFIVSKNEDQNYDLFVYSKGANRHFGTTPEKLMLSLESSENKKIEENSVVECKIENGNFIPVKIRSDKKFCNSYYVAKKTMVNARENITEEDLIKTFNLA